MDESLLVRSYSCPNVQYCIILFQAVLNQKFTDCFVLVFLDTQAGKTVSYSTTMIYVLLYHYCCADISATFSLHFLPEPQGCVSGATAITATGQQ